MPFAAKPCDVGGVFARLKPAQLDQVTDPSEPVNVCSRRFDLAQHRLKLGSKVLPLRDGIEDTCFQQGAEVLPQSNTVQCKLDGVMCSFNELIH